MNLFIASQVTWGERACASSRTPATRRRRTRLFSCDEPTQMALKMRIPPGPPGLTRSGQRRRTRHAGSPAATPSSIAPGRTATRWRLTLPINCTPIAMPDDPNRFALMYGPLVLAAHEGTDMLTAANLRAGPTKPRTVPEYPFEPKDPPPELVVDGDDPDGWLERVPGDMIRFRTVGQSVDRTLSPLNGVFDERYAVYWKVTPRGT